MMPRIARAESDGGGGIFEGIVGLVRDWMPCQTLYLGPIQPSREHSSGFSKKSE